MISYSYDVVGNVLDSGTLPISYGDDRRMSQTGTPGAGTTYTYDGRGFLSRSTAIFPPVLSTADTLPTYNSAGLLLHRYAHRPSAQTTPARNSHLYIFYFAGRPVATLDNAAETSPILDVITTTSTWQYLTVDHLGTPILVTSPSGTQIWQGGFEPFGADYSSSPTVLRFPGQWSDSAWDGNKNVGLYYNVHRWYEVGRGRYTQPDPIGLSGGDLSLFGYALGNTLRNIDRLGETITTVGCSAEQTTQVQAAAGDAEAASRTCLPCAWRQSFKDQIRGNITVQCWPFQPIPRDPICAGSIRADQHWSGRDWINLAPGSFERPEICGCLKSVLLHEILHLIRYEGNSELEILDRVQRCFSCAQQPRRDPFRPSVHL